MGFYLFRFIYYYYNFLFFNFFWFSATVLFRIIFYGEDSEVLTYACSKLRLKKKTRRQITVHPSIVAKVYLHPNFDQLRTNIPSILKIITKKIIYCRPLLDDI